MTSEIITDKSLIPWYRRPLVQLVWIVFLLPVWLILMWTGPSYYRTRGGYKTFGITAKVLLSTGGIFLIALGLGQMAAEDANSPLTASSPSLVDSQAPSKPSAPAPASAAPPTMRVAVEPSRLMIVITGDDDQPFTVQRVVSNGRVGERGCDSTLKPNDNLEPYTPTTLKRGDSTSVNYFCGDALLSADVYTDRGTASFKFDLYNK